MCICLHLLVLHSFRKQVRRWFCLCSDVKPLTVFFPFFLFVFVCLFVFKVIIHIKYFQIKSVVLSCFRRWGGHHGSNGVQVSTCTSCAARVEVAQAVKHCCRNVYTMLENSTTPCQPVPTCLWLTRNGGVQKDFTFSLKTQPLFALNMILSKRRTKTSITLSLVEIDDFHCSCCELCMLECCKLKAGELCMEYLHV